VEEKRSAMLGICRDYVNSVRGSWRRVYGNGLSPFGAFADGKTNRAVDFSGK
jgi:hypothetical protein